MTSGPTSLSAPLGNVIHLYQPTPLTVDDLRAQFEPQGLCDNGFMDPEQCAEFWNSSCERQGGRSLLREVDSAEIWLAVCEQTKAINTRSSSYGLKHEAERWCRMRGHEGGGYICNGALLMAAVRLGFKVQRCSLTSPNAWLNISRRRPQADEAT